MDPEVPRNREANPGRATGDEGDPAREVMERFGQGVRVLLSERLIAGVYSPGEKLSLRCVAAGLGVSMMQIREAVSRLVTDGALEVTPNRAVRVPILDLPRFRELTAPRIEIEGMELHQRKLAQLPWRYKSAQPIRQARKSQPKRGKPPTGPKPSRA